MPTSFTAPAGSLADVLDRSLGAFADVFDGAAGALAELADGPAGALADRFEGVGDALQHLRVAVERGQDAVDDRGDVVEPRPQQRLGFDALDVELDLAQLGMDADAQLDQVEYLGVQ